MAWFHKLHRDAGVGAKLLGDIGSGVGAGIAALSQDLTLNGITVEPTFRYEAKNATTGSWAATVGETLTGAGSGGTVELDTPFIGVSSGDEAVNGDGTRYWQAGDSSFANWGTDDIVLEVVCKIPPASSTVGVVSARTTGNQGWYLIRSGSNFNLLLTDGTSTTATISFASPTDNAWLHIIFFLDRSGSGIGYINGTIVSSTPSLTSVGSIPAEKLTLNAFRTDGLGPYTTEVAYVAQWQRDAWLDTHLQADLARERFLAAKNGLSNLSQTLTINSQTVSPTFRYEGKNATVSTWTATVGEDLTGAGSGGTFGLSVPFTDGLDKAVNGDGTRYWVAPSSFVTGTRDIVLEAVLQFSATSTAHIASTRITSKGWYIREHLGNGYIAFGIVGDAGSAQCITNPSLVDGAFYHVMFFCDRSGSIQGYVNGIARGGPSVVSAIGSVADDGSLGVAATSTGTTPYDKSIVYIAGWFQDNWLDTHLQADIAAERFAKLTGAYSDSLNAGPDISLLRNSVATLEKQGQSGGQKLFTVGARWPRIEKRPDKYNRYATGYNSEGQHTNLFTYSEQIDDSAWAKSGGLTVTPDSTHAPNNETVADTLVEDGTTTGGRFVSQTVTTAATTTYTASVYLRAINRRWVCLYLSGPNKGRYFDVADGRAGGSLTATPDSYGIRYIGNGWYLCWVTSVAPGTSTALRMYVAEDDEDLAFTGLSQDSVYMYGAQITATAYPVSYIKTDGTAVTRLADRYQIDGLTLPSSGTLVSETLSENVTVGNVRYIALSDATANNRVLEYRAASNLIAFVQTGGVSQANAISSIPLETRKWQEARMTYATDDVNMYVDGALGVNDSSATMPSGLTRITLGVGYSGLNQLDGLVRARLLSKPSVKNITDFGAIMSRSSAYISATAAVAQSGTYTDVGGTFTEVESVDITVSAAGVFTYTGTDTKRFAVFGACSGDVNSGTPLVTTCIEKNGTPIVSSESTRKIGSTDIGAWGVSCTVELANGDTLNFATKVDAGTPNLTMDKLSATVLEVS